MDSFSGELDFEKAPPWEEAPKSTAAQKLKFLCSYGGRILPRPHDNRLSYVGGDTKILAVDPPSPTFASLSSRLSSLSHSHNVSFKYQLPGHDLDGLISVKDDEDLLHLLHEYHRLSSSSPTNPPRLRLFLFPSPPLPSSSSSSPPTNLDFLFGLDQQPPLAPPPLDPAPSPPVSDTVEKKQDINSLHEKQVENVNFTVAGPPPLRPVKGVGGGVFPAGMGDRPVYMFATPGGVYHAPLFPRPQAVSACYPLRPRVGAGNVMVEPSTAAYGVMAPPQQMGGKVMRPVVGQLPVQMFYATGGGNFTPADSSP